jgi:hypothetical protein
MRKILCAAVWHLNHTQHIEQPKNIVKGCVFVGRRHSNCYEQIIIQNVPVKYKDCIDGFITNDNYFLTRSESFKIALEAHQLLPHVNENSDLLISEMLYLD